MERGCRRQAFGNVSSDGTAGGTTCVKRTMNVRPPDVDSLVVWFLAHHPIASRGRNQNLVAPVLFRLATRGLSGGGGSVVGSPPDDGIVGAFCALSSGAGLVEQLCRTAFQTARRLLANIMPPAEATKPADIPAMGRSIRAEDREAGGSR